MIIRGNNLDVKTDYYSNDVEVNMDVTDFDDIEEVIETIGIHEILITMKTKDLVDFLEIYEILEHKRLDKFFENHEYDMMEHLINSKGEDWVMEHISDDTVATTHRERAIDSLL